MVKLASGDGSRAVEEWVGRSPDSAIPEKVKLRILLRQEGRCALTGAKFGPKDVKHYDHIVALACGGQNRESNLQAIMAEPHKEKTKKDVATKAKIRRIQMKEAGLKPKAKTAWPKRPFPKRENPWGRS